MRNTSKLIAKCAVFATAIAVSGMAQAHPGHGVDTFWEGVSHPFGADHLLAIVAVGLWSLAALPAGKVWQGPATFMAALVMGAALGAAGVTLPLLEHALALSVTLFGVMVAVSRLKLPTGLGLSLLAVAGSLHGLAHGAESPATGFGSFLLGFVCTTAALHGAGVAAGLGIRRVMARQTTWAMAAVGTLVGGAGVYLFSQV